MLTVVLGSFIAVGVLAYALLGGGSHSYIDLPSFFLVLGGAISASLMSITKDNFRELFACIKTTFFGHPSDERKIKAELLLISSQAARAKHLGQLSHISTIPLINKATRLLQSEVDHNNMNKILSEVIAADKSMAMRCSDMIRTMSKYPPAFGMIGTILGLIGTHGRNQSLKWYGKDRGQDGPCFDYDVVWSSYFQLYIGPVIRSHSKQGPV